MKKKRKLKFKRERVILSDVLPYEIPITFSNRHLYDFLVRHCIKLTVNGKDAKIGVTKNSNVVAQEITKLMFGINTSKPFLADSVNVGKMSSIPFGYKIVHKENDFRELSIIHPRNQLAMIQFYDTFGESVLYHCSVSPFSIRRPNRLAKFTFFRDSLHIQKLADPEDPIEQNDKEYENLKTYFVYKKYSNVHKFYESYQYHRCEKKYNRLFRFDISKCFDSIYSHSISWAIYGKEVAKKNLDRESGTFANAFDNLIQALNFNETNGIVIGPEFSRIFAEIILQRVDVNAKDELEKAGILFRRDYEVFRYVDDYFLFYNDELVKDEIVSCFRLKLKEFKLYLNASKAITYDKPIITEITIGKQKVIDLFSKTICYKLEEEIIEERPGEKISKLKGSILIDSNRLTTKFKTIVFESKIEYKDILNYTLAIIERKLKSIIKDYFRIVQEKHTEKQFIGALLELLEFVFFIYSISPRVNSTIKLCRILRLVHETLSVPLKFNRDLKHLVFKKCYDNIYFILQKNKTVEHTQVETLYLLIALSQFGKDYWLTEDALAGYLCINKSNLGSYNSSGELNYFTLTVSLFYMKDKKRFNTLRDFIIDKLMERFESVDYDYRLNKAELILLLFDTLTYPFVDITKKKRKLLTLYNITDPNLQDQIINARQQWFTDWKSFDFGKELDAKHSQEVY